MNSYLQNYFDTTHPYEECRLNLPEFKGKEIFKQFGIPIPRGNIAANPRDARKIATEIGKPVAIKAQVLVGGRGKAGGISFADDPEEAEKASRELLGSEIRGVKVRQVLVEEKLKIAKELYLGVTVDRSLKMPVVITSSEGGVDIEEVAEKFPDKVYKRHADPVRGLQDYQTRYLIKKIGLKGKQYSTVVGILMKLYDVFKKYDAELAEINPLVITEDGYVVAADARLNIDDSSLFRHPEFKTRVDVLELSPRELKAREAGLAYVELDGNIGIIGNGAGLVMATLDVVKLFGGKPANFCDVGGGAKADMVVKAADLVLSKTGVKLLLINILGGITRCDEIAEGLVEIKKKGVKVPMVVRMVGTNEEEGRRICEGAGIHVLDSMDAAVKMAVKLAGEVG